MATVDVHQQPSRITIQRARTTGPSSSSSQSQSFWRKTARGQLQRVVHQHYLRPLSSFPPLPSSIPNWVVLDTNVVLHQFDLVSSPQFPAILLVAQTVLDEVRHRSLPLWNRLRALCDENATKANTSAEQVKRAYTVWNEASEELFLETNGAESPNDRNDRAIRHLASYYAAHLGTPLSASDEPSSSKRQKTTTTASAKSCVILLTDDEGNKQQAQAQKIPTMTVREYVHAQPQQVQDELLDLLAQAGIDSHRSAGGHKGRALYPEYLLPSVLQAGVKAGKLFQGHFNPNPYNYKEATVACHGRTKPILLVGLESMNRSVAGDVIVVELLPESQWQGAAVDVVDADTVAKNDDPDAESADGSDEEIDGQSDDDEDSTKPVARKDVQPTGRVVGVMKRNWRTYVCHLDRSSLPPAALTSTTSTPIFASPVSRSIPRIRILTRQAALLSTQKFLVSIDRWPTTSKYPEGHFVRTLGQVGSKEGELESLLEEWEVPYRPFSNAILSCLPEEGDSWVVPPKDDDPKGIWQGRVDMRDEIVCSIDPPGCQDIDDALHAKRLPNGNIEAGVHIADVSHFVHPDNPMDAEAASRGTTVYLVDKRVDMLPALLGTNLCSLRPYVERLAFSVIWEIDDEANLVDVRFTKTVIASKEAFTYEAAQKRKDNKSLNDPLTNGIRLLNSIAIKLRAKRFEAGALNLASPEVKIHMESAESSEPIDVEQKEMYETNSLVEEFMLLANISVARRIYEQFPQTAVLRRHAPPPKTNFEVLQDVLAKRRGMSLDASSSGALAKSLDECVVSSPPTTLRQNARTDPLELDPTQDPELPAFNTLVRIMATRCMLSAEYFCSGSLARSEFSHYGLASPIYTHFTSPIRRYADVLVHRQLSAACSSTPLHAGLQTKAFVEKTLGVVNKRHRGAQQAARASIEFYVALAIEGRETARVGQGLGKVRAEAFVIRTFRNGVAVFVSQFGLEGLVTFKRENDYDAEKYEISIPTSKDGQDKVTIGVFDKVTVEISVEKDKNTQRGKVRMELVEPVDSRGM
ncbi:BZ3500_MvSof-1268-A1-R1_Chr11-2g03395 [Microbotryum saponariae]|uniref:Ribosomal RNA-processing protein 44 n=1 Tax=Microbotryum saponariae TaxID=289078 RepID=A0A2X0N7P1_9BASI|nr:BZ3500_MvSof-1268-A1-R1_Chr11-2g03395 [Microbotryum saponariae]SDA03282.1 BZ3501_MvSof-1269-A2-R1_Chr11g02966 [Microbotryum saponariae]